MNKRHVTPERELQSYRAVTLREREWNERHTARDRENTGVSVFTRVNVNGIRQLKGKRGVQGSRRGNAG
jgi:hypothetical protein